MFENVLRKNEHIFPKEMREQRLFEDVYFKVCTRCFGFGSDSTSLIPMADMLNHTSTDINYEIINISLHQDGELDESYFRISKFFHDYSAVFKAHGFTEQQMKDLMLNVSGRFNRESFQKNQELLSVESMKKGMQARGKHIWELPFYSNTYPEDNDTSDDEEEDSDEEQTKVEVMQGNKTKRIVLREGHGLEFFLEKEEEFLVKKKRKQQKDDDISGPQLQLLAKLKINELVQSAGACDARLLYLLEKQSVESDIKLDDCKLDIDDEVLNASEYINVLVEGKNSKAQ